MQFWIHLGEPIRVFVEAVVLELLHICTDLQVFSERMASYFNAYTLYSHLRPFGISVIYSTCHPVEGPRLYLLEPAGIAYVRDSDDVDHYTGLLRLFHR